MREQQPPSEPGVRGSASGSDGQSWNLWDRMVIVHIYADRWAVAVEAPGGHYEVVPIPFRTYGAARDWLINFEIEALS